jgi:Protein of unknown function (DUF3309)
VNVSGIGSGIPDLGRLIRETAMSLTTILLVILVLMLIGAIPSWPHSRSWGYGPSGAIGTIAIVLVVLVLLGRI